MKAARKARGLTQEDFSDVSNRTYLSSLERGEKSPALGKVDALCGVMGLHPLTLLTLAYLNTASPTRSRNFWTRCRRNSVRFEGAPLNW